MARRAQEWNKGLAHDLRDPAFARAFIQATLDDGLPLQVVLGKIIRTYGVKEFSKRVKMPSPNLLRAIHPKHNPTQETLNRLLRPFGLKLSVNLIELKSKRSAA